MDSNKYPPHQPGGIIDASPGPDNKTKGVQNTKAWQQASGGMKQAWTRYIKSLADNFRNQSREEQEALINKFCIIMTMGVFALFMSFFYSFLPIALRLLSLPLLAIGSYFAGSKIVTPVMIQRWEKYLN